jgi:hypothetical protein
MRQPRLCHPQMQLLAALAFLLLALPFMAHPSQAQVRSINLREMIASAGTMFVGTVTDVRGGRDSHGDIVTYTTFSVEQNIHGVSGTTVTVKQFGGEADGITTRLEHMRYFRRNERVLVMFYPVSELGFTSPVGLEQAVWNIGSDNQVYGVRPEILQGLGTEVSRQGISMKSGTIERTKFIALIRDVLAATKTLKKGGSNR